MTEAQKLFNLEQINVAYQEIKIVLVTQGGSDANC